MVAVEKCANFARVPPFRAERGLSACSACAGDYENPDVTAPPGETPAVRAYSGEPSENVAADGERMEEEDPACEQTEEEA